MTTPAPPADKGWAVLALDYGAEPDTQHGGHVNVYCRCSHLPDASVANDVAATMRRYDEAAARKGFAYVPINTADLPCLVSFVVRARPCYLGRLPEGSPPCKRVKLTIALPEASVMQLGIDSDALIQDLFVEFGELVLAKLRKKSKRLPAHDALVIDYRATSAAFLRTQEAVTAALRVDDGAHELRLLDPTELIPAVSAVVEAEEEGSKKRKRED